MNDSNRFKFWIITDNTWYDWAWVADVPLTAREVYQLANQTLRDCDTDSIVIKVKPAPYHVSSTMSKLNRLSVAY